jgi:hypothetical protein
MKNLFLDLVVELIYSATNIAEYSESQTVRAPNWIAKSAAKGLKIRSEQSKSNQCCLPVGLARANQLVNRSPLSLNTLKRMQSFLARSGATLKPDTAADSKLAQALLLWGAEPSSVGVKRTQDWLSKQILKLEQK